MLPALSQPNCQPECTKAVMQHMAKGLWQCSSSFNLYTCPGHINRTQKPLLICSGLVCSLRLYQSRRCCYRIAHLKRLRWLGHTFEMSDSRLHKKLLFGQVKGRRPPGCPRSSFTDVAVRDGQLRRLKLRRIRKPYKDAQNRLLWRHK